VKTSMMKSLKSNICESRCCNASNASSNFNAKAKIELIASRKQLTETL